MTLVTSICTKIYIIYKFIILCTTNWAAAKKSCRYHKKSKNKFYICNRNVFRQKIKQRNRNHNLLMQKKKSFGHEEKVCSRLHELPFHLTGCFAIFKMFNLLVVCCTTRNVSVCVRVYVCTERDRWVCLAITEWLKHDLEFGLPFLSENQENLTLLTFLIPTLYVEISAWQDEEGRV